MAARAELDYLIKVHSELDRLERQMASVRRQADGTNLSTAKSSRAAAVAARSQAQAMLRVSSVVRQTGSMMTRYLTIPLIAVGVASAKMAIDFDTSLRKTKGLVGVSAAEIAILRKGILDMAPAVGKVPTELADSIYYIESVGFRGKAALDILRISAQDAAAGLGETKTVADALTSVMVAYGRGTMSAAKASDILIATITQGKMAPDALAGGLGRVISVAHNAGMTFADLGASMAAMSRVGLKTQEGATALRGILMGFLKPSKATAKALDGVGLSAQAWLDVLHKKGALAAYQLLLDKTKKHPELLAKLIPNVRAYNGFLTIMGGKLSDTQAIFAKVNDATGGSARAFKDAHGPGLALSQAWGKINAAGIKFGDDVLPKIVPMVGHLADTVSHLVDEFDKLPDAQKNAIMDAGVFLAATGPILQIVGMVGQIAGAWKLAAATRALYAGGSAVGAAGGVAEGAAGGAAATGGLAGIAAGPLPVIVIGMSAAVIYEIQKARVKPEIAPGGTVTPPKTPFGTIGPSVPLGGTAGPPGVRGSTVGIGGFLGNSPSGRAADVALAVYKRALDDAAKSGKGLVKQEFALSQSMKQHGNAALNVRKAQLLYNTAVKVFGPQSDAAQVALGLLRKAQDTAAKSARGAKGDTDKLDDSIKSLPPGKAITISTPGASTALTTFDELGKALINIGFNPTKGSPLTWPTAPGHSVSSAISGAHSADVAGTLGPSGTSGDIGDVPIKSILAGIRFLVSKVGGPYVWGGTGPTGYDCSGLVTGALNVMGMNPDGRLLARDMSSYFHPGTGSVVEIGTLGSPAHHTGIGILGRWFEAKGRAYGILGPGSARTQWDHYYALAQGGIVRARPGGVPTILGEGGRDEMVVPLPRTGPQLMGGDGAVIHIHNHFHGDISVPDVTDAAQFGDEMASMGYSSAMSGAARAGRTKRILRGF